MRRFVKSLPTSNFEWLTVGLSSRTGRVPRIGSQRLRLETEQGQTQLEVVRAAPVVRIYRPLSVQWRRCVHTARPRVVKKPWQWGDVARRAMHSGGGRNSEPASVPSVTDGHQGGCGWACFTAVSRPWRPGDACHRARTEVIQLTPARARHHAATAGGFTEGSGTDACVGACRSRGVGL
jgi:hypothetical protein